METTIYKTVKGSVLEELYNHCTTFSIRYYNTVAQISEDNYVSTRRYKFEIKIRHAEGTDANELFEAAINTESVFIRNVDMKMLKKQKAELVRLQFYPKKYNLSQKQVTAIVGITNLLDSIQDAVKKRLTDEG
jgi:hypothetical protein